MAASASTDLSHRPCLCASHLAYAFCCQPYHLGLTKPPTAVSLMRARYTAYALRLTDFIVQTTAPKERSKDLATSINASNHSVQWLQLEIHESVSGGPQDKKGVVSFSATFSENGNIHTLHERSRFLKIANQWFYLDGIVSP